MQKLFLRPVPTNDKLNEATIFSALKPKLFICDIACKESERVNDNANPYRTTHTSYISGIVHLNKDKKKLKQSWPRKWK